MGRLLRPLMFLGLILLVTPTIAGGQTLPVQAKQIDRLSVSSLLLRLVSRGQPIATATGFVIQKGNSYYLVTNWHVVAGKRPDNDAPLDSQGRIPDQVEIFHNSKGRLGEWHWVSENLLDSTTHAARWVEHPRLGKRVDVVMLPLTKTDDSDLYPVDVNLRNTPIRIQPAGAVSVVGFPFGHSSYLGLAIWKAGTIASDPDVEYDKAPQFLVDATGRPGMSGSPVYARRVGGYLNENGNYSMMAGTSDKFLGVFAGSIDEKSEIGRVWKASALMEIYDSLK